MATARQEEESIMLTVRGNHTSGLPASAFKSNLHTTATSQKQFEGTTKIEMQIHREWTLKSVATPGACSLNRVQQVSCDRLESSLSTIRESMVPATLNEAGTREKES